MSLPTFLVIGAQKAGTTSLHAYLSSHSDIYMPSLKEPHFFVEGVGPPSDRDWYERLFDAGSGHRHRGEASPSYSMFPFFDGAPRRIAEMIPDARLIYLIRDPIERMRSAYIETLMSGNPIAHRYGGIERALLSNLTYFFPSLYMLQIEQYLRHFERDQILVVVSEQLRTDRQRTIDRVMRHLGLATGWSPPELAVEWNRRDDRSVMRPRFALAHQRLRDHGWYARSLGVLRHSPVGSRTLRPDEESMPTELRRRLATILRPDLERLQEFLGAGFDAWGLLDADRPLTPRGAD